MADTTGGKGFFGQFNRQFWLVNAMELFERGSYYAFMSIWSLHLVFNLGASEEFPGLLYAPMIAFLYFVPLLSAALAEKFGYRLTLICSFILMIIGYGLMIAAASISSFVLAIVFMGVGAGAFKPMISATIAHITRSEQRNVAYSIYYWMINFGATVFPLAATFYLVSIYTDVEPTVAVILGAPLIFTISTVFVGINLFMALTLYRDPVKTKPEVSISQAIAKIVPALMDRKFVLLLAIYTGFWFMFAFNHTYMPLYMVQFGKMPTWFTATLLATINPGTIIIAGPFLAKVVEKQDSLKMMIVGILMFCTGLMVVAFSIAPLMFVAGIVIFSIGEFMVHPNFIAYVSRFAPKDKVAIYMACIFLPIGVGNIVGGLVQSQWYVMYAIEMQQPKLYIASVAAVGVFTCMMFIIYNRWRFGLDVKDGKKEASEGGFLVRPITPVVVVCLAPILIIAGAGGGTEEVVFRGYGEGDEEVDELVEVDHNFPAITGEAGENTEEDRTLNFEHQRATSVSVTLTWTDEGSSYVRGTNEPDEMGFLLTAPGGESFSSDISTSGSVSESFTLDESMARDHYTGEWIITIICGDCGDDYGPLGFRSSADTSASFRCTVTITYMGEAEE